MCFGRDTDVSGSICSLTLEVGGHCHSERQITVACRSGPPDRIVRARWKWADNREPRHPELRIISRDTAIHLALGCLTSRNRRTLPRACRAHLERRLAKPWSQLLAAEMQLDRLGRMIEKSWRKQLPVRDRFVAKPTHSLGCSCRPRTSAYSKTLRAQNLRRGRSMRQRRLRAMRNRMFSFVALTFDITGDQPTKLIGQPVDEGIRRRFVHDEPLWSELPLQQTSSRRACAKQGSA